MSRASVEALNTVTELPKSCVHGSIILFLELIFKVGVLAKVYNLVSSFVLISNLQKYTDSFYQFAGRKQFDLSIWSNIFSELNLSIMI